jgi:hypothetical protein
MTDHIRDLLDDASDDAHRPLGFTAGDLSARGRRTARRRTALVTAGAGLTVAAVIGGVALAGATGGQRTAGPAQDPTTPATSVSESPETPTAEEQALLDRCNRLPDSGEYAVPASAMPDGQVLGDLRDLEKWRVRNPDLTGWTVDAYLTDEQGTTATFVNPDATRYAVCELSSGGIDDQSSLSQPAPLPSGPLPNAEQLGNQAHMSWSQVCSSSGGAKVCGREEFHGGVVLYDGVTSVRVDAPDGTRVDGVLGDYTWVMRHVEDRVAADRAANDTQPLPPMWATYLDAQGNSLARFNFFPALTVPDSCLGQDHGC